LQTAERLRGALEPNDLELAALTLVEDWTSEHETPSERVSADAAIALTKSFDGALLVLCQMPGKDRKDLRERQRRLFSCVRTSPHGPRTLGVGTTFHPNSPKVRFSDQRGLRDPGRAVYRAPWASHRNLGHVARGGMDPLAVVQQYRERINHVHAKDMDDHGRWALIGTGVVPVAQVAELLQRTGYEGCSCSRTSPSWLDETPTE